MKIRKLKPLHDPYRKSYRSAKVVIFNDKAYLYFGRLIIAIASHPAGNGKFSRLCPTCNWNYNDTSIRYTKEFVKQYMCHQWFQAYGLMRGPKLVKPIIRGIERVAYEHDFAN